MDGVVAVLLAVLSTDVPARCCCRLVYCSSVGRVVAAPEDDAAIVQLARVYFRMPSPAAHDMSVSMLKRAAALRPDLAEYHCLLGVALVQVRSGR